MDGSGLIGLDIGGAHLKAALFDEAGTLRDLDQWPCPLWQGLDRLEAAVAMALARWGPPRRAAATMTGELADLFDDRADGVRRIAAVMQSALPAAALAFFAGPRGLVTADAVADCTGAVASANWYATALVAAQTGDGVLLDIGSTTTDIVPLVGGGPRHAGYSDAERLESGELVYTGVVRTPVMAVARAVPHGGRWRTLMAELFATMADVHRLTGTLPDGADQHPAADGRGHDEAASARRLLRMVGDDLEPEGLPAARRLARHLAERQLRRIEDALDQVLSRGLADSPPLVGAGVGRILVRRLAERRGAAYRDFEAHLPVAPDLRERAGWFAPAVSVGWLALHRGPPG
ncbi:hydantoinase/oxoprolinase family protein [Azospirillum isscasi]|uniref:Hydantoinase/oxoprolinase family protein n=1 Tax=Azospirillum isscasi TaxID=3053926 RepID=A0ABU0WQ95_9PROT|nr:hydantoinase/oxoprolinase family protein [Azospirillum isscasi]MDQ2106307.1 hydantoinase/oxoprolinase family protein [Azospirillum isscasi]